MFIKIGNWFGFVIIVNEIKLSNDFDLKLSEFRVILIEEDKRVMRR